ncbi:MAG: hypothetical protein ACK5A1_04135 [Planctomyces sp.]|jgi:hypothetical protein|nr:hypothetical protein [Planctomyces sp.]
MIKANWVNGHAIPVEDVNWLEWYDSLEPLVFEPGEEEAIEGMRRAIREKSSAGLATVLEGLFE